jgi:hypothetical protein
VDDIAIASKDPKAIIDELTTTHKFKLKGTGPIRITSVYFRDADGTLCCPSSIH